MDGRVSSVGGRIRCAMCTSFTWTHQRCCAHTEGRQEMQRGKVRGELHVQYTHFSRLTVWQLGRWDFVCEPISLWRIKPIVMKLAMSVIYELIIVVHKQRGEYAEGWWYQQAGWYPQAGDTGTTRGATRVRHQRRRPPSLKLTRSLQQAVVGTYTVQDCSVLHWALTALELSSNQPTVCTKAGRCSSKPISASTPLFTILFCTPCICLLARLTERFYK